MFTFNQNTQTTIFSILFFTLTLTFFSIFLHLFLNIGYFYLSLSIFPIFNETLDISITLSTNSMLFSTVVSLISCVVYLFIPVYFQSTNTTTYFNYFTAFFVLSMLILINITDFFFVMLGWDGLGVTSYFLIAYYQSPNSLFSSSFTLLINRIGDCFFVVFITMMWTLSPTLKFSIYFPSLPTLTIILFLALSTNSAIFPFSPWLPAAIAAPTPISSLVHSSTLVTAGLYLLIQNPTIMASSGISFYVLVVSLFTSFYAGLASILESDLNNVVALSTLSHLGFIGTAVSLEIPHLAFFHLLAHALFNSSLFLSIGMFITTHGHYQDSRYLTNLSSSHSLFTSTAIVSEANLLGLPFLSGFYSNDLILEFSTNTQTGCFLQFLLFFNILFTFCYTLRVILSLCISTTQSPLLLISTHTSSFWVGLSILSVISIFFGNFQVCAFISYESTIPTLTKLLPSFLLLSSILFWILLPQFSFYFNPFIASFCASILSLSSQFSNNTSYIFLNIINQASIVDNLLSNMLYQAPLLFVTNSSNTISYLFYSTPQTSAYFISFFLLLLFILTI